MPIRDVAAMNRSLDNDYGTTRGPNAPASHNLRLYAGDPITDGVEASGGGYAAQNIAPADWLPAADGEKSLAAVVEFPVPTGSWGPTITHWALTGVGDGGLMWDTGILADPLDVTGPGERGPLVRVTVFYDDAVTAEEG